MPPGLGGVNFPLAGRSHVPVADACRTPETVVVRKSFDGFNLSAIWRIYT